MKTPYPLLVNYLQCWTGFAKFEDAIKTAEVCRNEPFTHEELCKAELFLIGKDFEEDPTTIIGIVRNRYDFTKGAHVVCYILDACGDGEELGPGVER